MIWARDAQELFELCETVVLSVRPDDFPVPGFAPEKHLLISFMAGWSLSQLQEKAPEARIVRAMPNGGATSGQSFTPWLTSPGVSSADTALVARVLAAMGQEDRIETEDQLHYLSALSGSGAAYPALMARTMLGDAITFGLSKTVALRAVEAVICGSAGLLTGKLDQVDELLESYISYKGITVAGLIAAEATGFETSVRAPLSAALAKARSMGAS